MLCSARELGLSEDHGGLLELPGDAPVGKNFRDYYQLNDLRFTIKLTPNRADCLSVLGVALGQGLQRGGLGGWVGGRQVGRQVDR